MWVESGSEASSRSMSILIRVLFPAPFEMSVNLPYRRHAINAKKLLTSLTYERNERRVPLTCLLSLALTQKRCKSAIVLEHRLIRGISANAKPCGILVGLMLVVNIGFGTSRFKDLTQDSDDVGVGFLVRSTIIANCTRSVQYPF